MKTFIYYNKFDPTQEPYGKFEAVDEEDAVLIASHIKQLSIDEFLEVFIVKEL